MDAKEPDCKYNKLLECPPDQRQCWRCGRNPRVMSDRLAKFYGRRNEEEEK